MFEIFFLMINTVFAGSQQDGLMPDGFEQVYIGMDWRSLVSLRPNAEIMNMMPDPNTNLKPNPEKPKNGLVEKLAMGQFDRVLYSFEDGVLVAVMFGKEKSRSIPSERENVIRKIAQGRGMPIRIQMTGNRHDQGVLHILAKARNFAFYTGKITLFSLRKYRLSLKLSRL